MSYSGASVGVQTCNGYENTHEAAPYETISQETSQNCQVITCGNAIQINPLQSDCLSINNDTYEYISLHSPSNAGFENYVYIVGVIDDHQFTLTKNNEEVILNLEMYSITNMTLVGNATIEASCY